MSKELSPERAKYGAFLSQIKEKVKTSQVRAAVKVNQELIQLYWEIGTAIHQKQEEEGWGAQVIERLAKDLKSSFPGMKGFSSRNLHYMLQICREYAGSEILQQLVAKIPWGHNILILQKLKANEERIWYIQKTIEHGWSRNVLAHWISSRAYERQGKALNNFEATLPKPQSDLARETLKDPYNFDFLTMRSDFEERELEDGLIKHIQKFLLELGAGFAFLGRQYPITISDTEYFIDLLFYHTKLRCYCVIELKSVDFKPEFAGKMNFYLSAVDDLLKHEHDNPTIGILLCKSKDHIKAEYALRDVHKPIGVAEYEVALLESLPDDFKGSLPTIEELEEELKDDLPKDLE